jgi:uncharacterized membrane protein YqiK
MPLATLLLLVPVLILVLLFFIIFIFSVYIIGPGPIAVLIATSRLLPVTVARS